MEYTLKLGRSCGDRRRVFAIEFGRSCRHCERPIDLPLPQQRFAQKVEVLYMRFDGDCLVEPPNGLRISPGGKQGEAKEPDARLRLWIQIHGSLFFSNRIICPPHGAEKHPIPLVGLGIPWIAFDR